MSYLVLPKFRFRLVMVKLLHDPKWAAASPAVGESLWALCLPLHPSVLIHEVSVPFVLSQPLGHVLGLFHPVWFNTELYLHPATLVQCPGSSCHARIEPSRLI